MYRLKKQCGSIIGWGTIHRHVVLWNVYKSYADKSVSGAQSKINTVWVWVRRCWCCQSLNRQGYSGNSNLTWHISDKLLLSRESTHLPPWSSCPWKKVWFLWHSQDYSFGSLSFSLRWSKTGLPVFYRQNCWLNLHKSLSSLIYIANFCHCSTFFHLSSPRYASWPYFLFSIGLRFGAYIPYWYPM